MSPSNTSPEAEKLSLKSLDKRLASLESGEDFTFETDLPDDLVEWLTDLTVAIVTALFAARTNKSHAAAKRLNDKYLDPKVSIADVAQMGQVIKRPYGDTEVIDEG